MDAPGVPVNETERLEYLQSLSELESPDDDRFDRLTNIAALAFAVPIAAVGLVDVDRLRFKSVIGLDVPEMPRQLSFCGHTICGPDLLVVEDTLLDPRFADNPLVTDGSRIRFYAGCPLDTGTGHAVGCFSIMDVEPRRLDQNQMALLQQLAAMAASDLTTIGAKAALRALTAGEDLHRTVIDVLDEGVVVIDENGLMLSANASAARILNATLEPGVPPPLPANVIDGDGEPLAPEARPIPVTLSTGKPQTNVIMGGSRVGNTMRWIRVNTQPLFHDGAERPWAAVASIADVTDTRAVQQVKDEFVSVVSHELRTPLTSIRGALSLLASGKLGAFEAKPRQMLDIAVKNTDRLVLLINDILDIERLDSGQAPLDLSSCDVGELIRDSIELLRPLADEVGVSVTAPSVSIPMVADPDRLVQTFTNLLSNALKFSTRGGSVQIGARRADDGVIVEVRDEGRGIPAEKLETIFGRFQQVDASDSRDRGGTGLGLAICQTIVEQHGGRIWVDSEVDVGSTFSLFLPTNLETGEAPSPAPDGVDVVPTGLRQTEATIRRVLVIEDDPDLAGVLSEVFDQMEVEVIHASNVEEAIVLGQDHQPDLIVLDVVLPDGDGFAVVEWMRLHTHLQSVPVIVHSAAEIDVGDRHRLSLGQTCFLTKSTGSADELERIVKAVAGVLPGPQGVPA